MTQRIFVLGAAGRLGFAAASAFRDAGWDVLGLVRPRTAHRAPRGIRTFETIDRAAAVEAGRGMDVVLHALNPRYTDWKRLALPLAYSAIEIAEANGATLLFPGNVYNFGPDMPEVLDEDTPMHPSARKGALRVEMESRMREASERGMRTIVLRAGDFFGGGRGSWFDLVIAKDLAKGRATYPGPIDVVHAWAYLPDLAATFVKLAQARERFAAFETFGFPGHAVTGREFLGALAKAWGQGLRIRRMGWWLIHATRPIIPMSRELAEIAYLWRVPHRIDGSKLQAAIGDIPHTPLDRAMEAALRDLG